MGDEEDDFTFPANLPPCFFESPPLWQPPPRPENELEAGRFELCSCEACKGMNISMMGEGALWYDIDNDDDEKREEKMDLLWEDLDEKYNNNGGKIVELDLESDNSSPGRNVKICCIKTLKLSKQNGLKASILELIKFLIKKGFSMHNSGNSIKKIAW